MYSCGFIFQSKDSPLKMLRTLYIFTIEKNTSKCYLSHNSAPPENAWKISGGVKINPTA